MTTPTRAAVLLLVAVLTACAASTDAVLKTLQSAMRRDASAARAPLNPNLRYLRVTVDGRVVLLVLGDEERHPQGSIQVWYSAEREVVRFQNGRLVGAAGMTTEWRKVSLGELPSWTALRSTLADAGDPVRWVRERDVMPGYRYGVRDALSLRITAPPPRTALLDIDPQRLTWFEEQSESAPAAEPVLPLARYAVDFRQGAESVVYGEQCLAPALCFTWQRWPAARDAQDGR